MTRNKGDEHLMAISDSHAEDSERSIDIRTFVTYVSGFLAQNI